MKTTIDVLKVHRGNSAEKWHQSAEQRRRDWGWQKYSVAIALLIRRKMKEEGITQQQLAEKMGCSQQAVSGMLSGSANLTLESIAKFEDVLDYPFFQSFFVYLKKMIE